MRPTVLAALWLAALAGPCAAQPREAPVAEGRRALRVQDQRYGLLAENHADMQRARRVFDRIVRAAGRRPGLALDVAVLDTPRIIGQALPGGTVVVSRGLLDLAGADDNALAFVLSHEVAHLLRDHHAALQSLGALSVGRADTARPEAQGRAYRALELEADRLGVLFSALAGYEPSSAVPIIEKLAASAGPDAFHPSPRDRADTIRGELASVTNQLEVFRLGLFLLGAGDYLTAARVLEHFASVFPAREVLATAGVAWHKEALRYTRASVYQHMLIVDARPPWISGLTEGVALADMFKRHLDQAMVLYSQAADADPSYAPALNNLAAAYLDRGEREVAQGYIARALRADPTLASAYNNRGIAYALAGDARRAEENWQRALILAPEYPQIAENLARLHDSLGHAAEARAWRARIPARTSESHATQRLAGTTPGVRWSVRDQVSAPDAQTIQVPLGGLEADDFMLDLAPSRGVVIVVRRGFVEAVGIFGATQAATREGVRPGDLVLKVQQVYGRPRALEPVQTLSSSSYPTYGLTVFTLGNRVQAIWAGRTSR